MSVYLYINNERINLTKEQVVTITKQINNFGELKDRQSSFTNTFLLEKSSQLVKIFKNLGLTGNESRLPYRKVNVRLIVNGINVVENGYGMLSKLDWKGNKFSLKIYSGIITFFQKIANKKITDIPQLAELNHELTTNVWTGSFSHTHADGYIYGIADFGNTKTSKIEINYQLPSVYVRWIWDKIFSNAGFTPDFHPDDDLVITATRGWQSVIETLESWTESANAYNSSIGDNCMNGIEEIRQSDYSQGFYFKEIKAHFNPAHQHVTDDEHVTFTKTLNYKIKLNRQIIGNGFRLFSVLVTKTDANGHVSVVDEIFRNDAGVTETSCPNGQDGATYSYDFNVERTHVLNNGDILKFEGKWVKAYGCGFADCQDEDQNGDPIYYSTPDGWGVTNLVLSVETVNTNVSSVNVRSLLPEISQKDFIKDVLHHYGMMMRTDDNAIQFKKAKDMLKLNNVVDWSDYFVEKIDENYLLKNYAKKNNLKYHYNKDALTKFADDSLLLDNEVLPDEKDIITRPYNATEKSDIELNNYFLQLCQFWKPKRDDNGNITDWKPFKDKSYLARVKKENGTIHYGTHYGTTQTYTGDYPVLNFNRLNWNYLTQEFYQEINLMLDWNRIEHFKLKMNAFDFNQVDMFKLVYFKQTACYYYINKLKFNAKTEMVDAELVFVKL